MKVALRAAIAVVLALQLVFALARADAAESGPAFSVLLFSRTAGFRHDSIAAGIAAIGALGEQNNFRVDAGEDAKVFTDENLAAGVCDLVDRSGCCRLPIAQRAD